MSLDAFARMHPSPVAPSSSPRASTLWPRIMRELFTGGAGGVFSKETTENEWNLEAVFDNEESSLSSKDSLSSMSDVEIIDEEMDETICEEKNGRHRIIDLPSLREVINNSVVCGACVKDSLPLVVDMAVDAFTKYCEDKLKKKKNVLTICMFSFRQLEELA